MQVNKYNTFFKSSWSIRLRYPNAAFGISRGHSEIPDVSQRPLTMIDLGFWVVDAGISCFFFFLNQGVEDQLFVTTITPRRQATFPLFLHLAWAKACRLAVQHVLYATGEI